MANFLTTAKVKAVLRIPAGVTQWDDDIASWLAVAEEETLSYLGYPFIVQTTATETFDIAGSQQAIALDGPNVTSVAALTDDGSLVDADDYYVTANAVSPYLRLESLTDSFTQGRQKVAVTYTAGWSSVPERFTMAAALIAAGYWNQGPTVGFESEKMGSRSYRKTAEIVPRQARALLNGWRRIMPRRRYNED